ncbi:MAG: hypothetical protein FWG90_05450 [Oscillospiraceae bacterium]|nr:hypothetical protein [Oscillospiraceae bacterium]
MLTELNFKDWVLNPEEEELYEKNMKLVPEGTQIDFLEECENAAYGEMKNYPLDDITIMAFAITKEELSPYNDDKHATTPWTTILEEILSNRGHQFHL